MLIDCDVHNILASPLELLPFLDAYWAEEVRRQGITIPGSIYHSPTVFLRNDARPPSGQPGTDPAFTVRDLFERYGIDYGILTGASTVGVAVHPDPDYGNAIASAYNSWTAAKWLAASDRFRGSIIVNHSDPAAAAREIARCAPDKRFVQVAMSSASRTPLGQRMYHPIYAACAEHGLPIALHIGSEGAGISGTATTSGFPTRYFEWHNILPTHYMTQVNSFVCEGVFEKFPTLKLVLIEGGISWLPHLIWRMDKNFKALRAQAPWLKRLPSEYVREHVRLCTQPVEEPAKPEHLAAIFDAIHAGETVMFASDYPHWDFDAPDGTLNFLPAPLRRRILGDTAAELYRLPARSQP